MLDNNHVRMHLKVLFGSKMPTSGYINLRGIGEKGTENEGTFREDKFISLSDGDPYTEVMRHVARWSEFGIASFIVPAILDQPQGKSENVRSFCNLVVDLDSGNIDEKHKTLSDILDAPTAVVYSGGTVDGYRKRHLYWTLLDPSSDIPEIVRLRHDLALAGGGDLQFGMGVQSNPYGRAHQPVRIAGSIHGKGGVKTPVTIECTANAKTYGIQYVRDRLARLPKADLPVEDMFAPEKPALALTDKVYEGGDGEKNRWTQFSRVAGFYISCVRKGEMSQDEALDKTIGWMETSMVPPWPQDRAINEFRSILSRDLGEHGPMPEPIKPMVEPGKGLEIWAVHRWTLGPKPERRFLVEKLVLAAKHTLLVAEGGAGKTFLMLDLALKVSTYDPHEPQFWCGQKVAAGGTVVILTTEDDKDELHIRLHDIDPQRRRETAGDKLIVLPTINSGGSFPLVEKDPKTGEARPSRKWTEFMALLRSLDDLALVVVDTLNSTLHGEENSATVANEFVRAASQVCGELGAALIITHHIRKQGDEPIRNGEQMLSSIRGSSALPSAFRAVLGIWHCSDYERRLNSMGHPARRGVLWKMAVVKANNPEMLDTEKTLLRQEHGLLQDVTENDSYSSVNIGERHAWLALAIQEAARQGHPYSIEGKNAKSGLYKRRSELPPVLRQVGPSEFIHMVDDLLMRKAIRACAAKGGKDKKWLDIPNGPIATDEAGAELASGAYTPPTWDGWEYDHAVGCCIRP